MIWRILLLLPVIAAGSAAASDRDSYNLRAATEDLAVFHQLARDGVLEREMVLSDLNFGPRFDEADANRDGKVTLEEITAYIGQTYGIAVSSSAGAGKP